MMHEALGEFLVVLAHSTKTQIAAIFGLAFFVGMMLAGDYFTSQLEMHGIFAPLTDVIREKIAHRYDKVAWASLLSFSLLAFKCYRRDRKRIMGL